MDKLTSMAVFNEVVESESFSGAARELGLSRSAVSRHVSRLEEDLHVRLLNRTTRRLSVTEAGAAFYDHCRRVVAEAEAAEQAVTHLQSEPRGVIKLNAPMDFGRLHVAPILPQFLERHPEVAVDMTLNDRFVDLIEEGFDVAIRITRLPDSSLVARKIGDMGGVLCATPEYFARRGIPKTPDDLARHNCLIYTYMPTQNEWTFAGPEGQTIKVRVNGNFRTNNGAALREAVLGGLGIGLLPDFIVGEDLREGRLQPALQNYGGLDGGGVYAVYPHRRHLSPKVRAFVDFLVLRFAPAPGRHTLAGERGGK